MYSWHRYLSVKTKSEFSHLLLKDYRQMLCVHQTHKLAISYMTYIVWAASNNNSLVYLAKLVQVRFVIDPITCTSSKWIHIDIFGEKFNGRNKFVSLVRSLFDDGICFWNVVQPVHIEFHVEIAKWVEMRRLVELIMLRSNVFVGKKISIIDRLKSEFYASNYCQRKKNWSNCVTAIYYRVKYMSNRFCRSCLSNVKLPSNDIKP